MSISNAFEEVICIKDLNSTDNSNIRICSIGGIYNARKFVVGGRDSEQITYYRITRQSRMAGITEELFEEHFRRINK